MEQCVEEPPQMLRECAASITQPHPHEVKRAVRRDYVEGKGSTKRIAQAHGVPYETVREWITAGDWQALREKRDQADLAAITAVPAPTTIAPIVAPLALDARLATLTTRMARLDEMIAASDDWREIEALSRALSRDWDTWYTLTGHPRPGTRRVRSGRQASQVAEPIGPAPAAAAVPVQPTYVVKDNAAQVYHSLSTPVLPSTPAPTQVDANPERACDILPGDGAGI